MDHVLDNPAWNALATGNSSLANGNDEVKYFSKDVSPFVGFKSTNNQSFKTLYDLLPHGGAIGYISPQPISIPTQWDVLQTIKCFQMIFEASKTPSLTDVDLVELTDEHVAQMLELTKLTNPGPFAPKTINFGHYRGIFEHDRLAAMAGQRLHVANYAEISAVCTHPDFLGKGYARQLLIYQINRIKAASNIPFLHVRHDNYRAVGVYESLGFATRREIYFYILKKH